MTFSASVCPWPVSVCFPAVSSGLLTGLLSFAMVTGAAVAQETAAPGSGVELTRCSRLAPGFLRV
ncbi:MAG: hypothetical protein HC857_09285 [Synechococcales cyanobacterium RU_4_20]|nr:hypothetical protein [Synechococcales cyanobacterium RU_4_20]